MLGKAACDTLKAIERASVETARFAVGVLCVDWNLCWKAARTLGVVSRYGRDSVSAILGQTVGGLLLLPPSWISSSRCSRESRSAPRSPPWG